MKRKGMQLIRRANTTNGGMEGQPPISRPSSGGGPDPAAGGFLIGILVALFLTFIAVAIANGPR